MERIPASERTREKLRALMEGRSEVEDGVAGTIDLSGELDGEVFQPLRDEAVFRQVTVDEFGAVCWPNGPDLAPDAMHRELTGEPPSQPRQRKQNELPAAAKPRPSR